MTQPTNRPPAPDMDDASVLREGLRTNPLSSEALQRIRAATEAEWRASVAAPPRRWRPVAIAASLLGVAVVAGLSLLGAMQGSAGGDVLANVLRSEARGVSELRTFRSDLTLKTGEALVSGKTYQTQGQALLALAGGGNLRMASGARIEVLGKNGIRLEAGEVYVDIPPGTHATGSFVAHTPAGEFRHVGTQFALAVSSGETRLRVREGVVEWLAADGRAAVKAGNEVRISRDGSTAHGAIEPSHAAWNWTSAMTPDFEVENRPLHEFLSWVARESGRELVLTDDATRKQVTTILMHGSVDGLAPMQALSAVMAATPLRYDLPEGKIRVSFAGDSPTPQ